MKQHDYKQARFERLQECIGEYLDDEDGSSKELLNDIQRACLLMGQYFSDRASDYTHVMEFFQ